MKFDRTVCVNLDRRQDRWQEFLNAFPNELGSVERYQAIDGKQVPHPTWWQAGGGAWGCYRSHLRILEECLNNNIESCLFLEDDATFPADFGAKFDQFTSELPDDWGMIYLGGQHLFAKEHPPVKVTERVYRPYNVNRTHAFAIRGKMMRTVYQHLTRADWHAAQHVDHHLGRLHQQRAHPIYTPAEWIVGQAEGWSNIAGKSTPERYWAPADRLVEQPARIFAPVIGLHSSGSSCLAMMLHELGVHMGNELGGYHGGEAVGLAQLCEKIAPFPGTTLKWQPERIRRRLAKWINARRREAAENRTVAGGKYPHLCALGEQLQSICGEDLRVVHIDRPLDESIESLQRRSRKANGWLSIDDPAAEAVQRWLWDCKQELLGQVEHLTISYDELLADPIGQIDRVTEYLELEPTATQVEAARAVANPAKRTVAAVA